MDEVEVDSGGLLGPETVLSTAEGAPLPPAAVASTRYETKSVLGSGGMGEVRLCRDRTIGREIAMKVMRPRAGEPSEGRWRFVREARVQAQLEHPAIVPVYDLGVDAAGRPTFTMKRVRGTSLAEVLRQLAQDDVATMQRFPQRRLLSLFLRLCDALAYVHSRGVLHRDLKPANVMLGEFGEVYLLDWGLAKLASQSDPAVTTPVHDASAAQTTIQGSLLGTPGYMAPEQLRDGLGPIGPWTDVYGLGLILFEILSLEVAHTHGPPVQRIMATLQHDGRSPAEATPALGIAPELDRVCVRATRRSPTDRIQSARELATEIEAYLDGDRDAELRATMAARHAESARAALLRAGEPGANETEERATAMREVGLALGMAPGHEGARRTLVELLGSPIKTVPEEARRRVDARFAVHRRAIFWGALWNYALTMLYVPLPLIMGVRSWTAFVVEGACIVSCLALTADMLRRHRERDPRLPVVHLVVSSLTVLASSSFVGPLIFVPFLALGNLMAYLIAYSDRRWLVIGLTGLSVALPVALASIGWFPTSYDVHDDVLVVHPIAVAFPPVLTIAFLFVTQVALLMVAGVLLGRLRDAYERAELAVELQRWQLEQMVPRA